MDTETIKAFLVLAKIKNFGKAAEELFISQPALSKQIQSLEQDLHVPLFNRTKKSTYLTMEGEYFLNYANNIIANYNNAKNDIQEITGLSRGTLRFGATNFIGVYLIPQILAQFNKLFPGITVEMSINSSKNILSLLDAYKLEFVLFANYVPINKERYISKPWYTDTLKVIVGKGNHLFNRHRVRIEELDKEVFITKEKDSSLYKFLKEQLFMHGLKLEKSFCITQQEAIKQAVIHNLGISVMSPAAIELEEKAGLVRALNITGYPLRRKIHVVYEKSWHLTPAAQEFLNLLQTINNLNKAS